MMMLAHIQFFTILLLTVVDSSFGSKNRELISLPSNFNYKARDEKYPEPVPVEKSGRQIYSQVQPQPRQPYSNSESYPAARQPSQSNHQPEPPSSSQSGPEKNHQRRNYDGRKFVPDPEPDKISPPGYEKPESGHPQPPSNPRPVSEYSESGSKADYSTSNSEYSQPKPEYPKSEVSYPKPDYSNSQPQSDYSNPVPKSDSYSIPKSEYSNSYSESSGPGYSQKTYSYTNDSPTEINEKITESERKIAHAERRIETNLQSLEEGRRLTEDGKKILNLLIEIDQKHIEILRNNMKKLSNDRLIYKLKERLTNVELKLLEDSMSEVDKNQMIIDKQILEKDSHDLLVEKSVIEAQKDIFVIEKKMLELLVSIKETAIKIDENKVELANSRGKSRTEIQHLQNGIATLERQQRADQSEWAIFKMSHKQAHIQRELLLIENRLNGEKRNVTRHLLMAQRDLFRAELSLIEIDLKVLDDYKLTQETSRQVDMRLMEWAKEWERKTGEMKANWNDMRKAIEHDSNIITKLIDQRFSPDYYK